MMINDFNVHSKWKYADGKVERTTDPQPGYEFLHSPFGGNRPHGSPDKENIDKTKKDKTGAKQGFKNVDLKNPFVQGFKKYVVLENFTAKKVVGEGTKDFKVGMNLFGVIRKVEGKDELVSYAGYVIPQNKVKEKQKNIFEKVQSFFSVKKGFA